MQDADIFSADRRLFVCFQGNSITEPSYSNESYDSVSLKSLDGFQNALHNKHIFIFGEVLITNMSLDITIYSTFLINLSFFINCFFHNTNYHSSESCS